MSLRLRLALLLFGVVLLALLLAWSIVARTLHGPVLRHLVTAYEQQVAFVANEIEQGRDPRELSRRLGLRLDLRRRPPPRLHKRCRPTVVDGRRLLMCRGGEGVAAAELSRGWLLVRRGFDARAVGRRLGVALVVLAALLGAFAWWLSGRLTRPLKATLTGMERMAQGDLRHRLEPEGSPEQREAHRAFNRMADRMQAMLDAERTLMAGMSHELRTPLARLRLEFELMRERAEVPGRLPAMEADLQELDRLIDELFTLSRLSFSKRSVDLRPVPLGELVEEVLAETSSGRLTWNVEGAPTTVQGDRTQLKRLLKNLVQNAEKYAPADSQATVRHLADGLEVEDRGPGVEPGELDQLFEPFFRGRNRRQATGWGLGLMIARQIAELHEGKVEARLASPHGLVIRMRLPRRGPEDPLRPTVPRGIAGPG